MQLKLNRYTVFYSLLLCLLLLYCFPQLIYDPFFSKLSTLFYIVFIFLFCLLPFYFVVISVIDLFRKRFRTTALNFVTVALLVIIAYLLKKHFLLGYVY